jgi:hypothetical protein
MIDLAGAMRRLPNGLPEASVRCLENAFSVVED